MSINYTLSIDNVTKKFNVGQFLNVIVDVSLSVNASSVEYPQFTYGCGGQIKLNVEELSSDSFVEFDQISKDTIVEWLLAHEGVESIEEFSYVKYSIQNIQDRIDQLQEKELVSLNYTVSNIPEPTLPLQDEEILNP